MLNLVKCASHGKYLNTYTNFVSFPTFQRSTKVPVSLSNVMPMESAQPRANQSQGSWAAGVWRMEWPVNMENTLPSPKKMKSRKINLLAYGKTPWPNLTYLEVFKMKVYYTRMRVEKYLITCICVTNKYIFTYTDETNSSVV